MVFVVGLAIVFTKQVMEFSLIKSIISPIVSDYQRFREVLSFFQQQNYPSLRLLNKTFWYRRPGPSSFKPSNSNFATATNFGTCVSLPVLNTILKRNGVSLCKEINEKYKGSGWVITASGSL